MSTTVQTERLQLLSRVTCPHCWKLFPPEDLLWVAASPELLNDDRLGADSPKRFLPSRFSVLGNAIDAAGTECQELACPHCHLIIPRPLLSIPSFYVSIAGTPSCGKSYFLASMTWQLRQTLPRHFGCAFGDADPSFNKLLNDYEEQQFFNADQDSPVKLAKTQEYGDLYSNVQISGQTYSFPQPFLFSIKPGSKHPKVSSGERVSRIVCLYDNAGESYQAGKDTVTNQVTRHLAVAHSYLFCFDPTQDPRFRRACLGKTDDYQMTDAPVTARQETVLYELIQRVRKHTSLGERERTKRPLLILCTKHDAWATLLDDNSLREPPFKTSQQSIATLNLTRIKAVSDRCRDLMASYSPELVGAAEGFSESVYFIPVSATGVAPTLDTGRGIIGVAPKDIRPTWCDVPLLLSLALWNVGLIPNRSK